jgi:hypothetical protein
MHWIPILLQFHPTPGSKRSQLHKMYQSRCTAKNFWWWAERLPETCIVVIPIKLEFSASVGFFTRNVLLPFTSKEGNTLSIFSVCYIRNESSRIRLTNSHTIWICLCNLPLIRQTRYLQRVLESKLGSI